MRGYSDILADMVQQGGFVAAHMNQISQGITRASVRLEQIISAMLDVSRIETGGLTLTREAVDVRWVTDRVVDEFTARHVRRRFRRPSGVEHLQLWADADRLHEIVANLVDNAVKYSPAGQPVHFVVKRDGRDAVFAVRDEVQRPDQTVTDLFLVMPIVHELDSARGQLVEIDFLFVRRIENQNDRRRASRIRQDTIDKLPAFDLSQMKIRDHYVWGHVPDLGLSLGAVLGGIHGGRQRDMEFYRCFQ